MGLFSRGRRKPAESTFHRACTAIDAAQRELLSAVPTARDPGVPLAEALAGFSVGLTEAERLLDAWEHPQRARCAAAIGSARAEAAQLRLSPGPLGFEALNARIGDVLHPLEVFVEIERSLDAPGGNGPGME